MSYTLAKVPDGEQAAKAEQQTALEAGKMLVKDIIADIAIQQTLTWTRDFDVFATMNLNGDCLSEALAAQVSGEMMLRYIGWEEATDQILVGMEGAIAAKTVTYDFHRLMEGATLIKTSEFSDAVIRHMRER